jgi:hypothetical protein
MKLTQLSPDLCQRSFVEKVAEGLEAIIGFGFLFSDPPEELVAFYLKVGWFIAP